MIIYVIYAKDPDNYELDEGSETTGDFEIKKAQLTVTVDNKTKTYGANDPEFTATVTGMKNGDTEAAIKAALDLKFTREQGENVGTYEITATGKELDNYTVTYVPGTLTITPNTDEVTVTITGNSATEVYDATEKSFKVV